MPRINKFTTTIDSVVYELELYYTSTSKFYLKEVPDIIKKMCQFTNQHETEQGLRRSLKTCINDIHERFKVQSKVIRIKCALGISMQWADWNNGSRHKVNTFQKNY